MSGRGDRFASDPAHLTIEKLGDGRVGRKDDSLAKAKLQLSSGSTIYTNKLKSWEFGKKALQIFV